MSNSPLYRRQLVKSGVDTAKAAMAGMVQNYEGEAIAAIGTIIGKAFTQAAGNKEKIDKQFQEEQDFLDGRLKEGLDQINQEQIFDEDFTPDDVDYVEDELDDIVIPESKKKEAAGETYSLDMFQSDFKAKRIAEGIGESEADALAKKERASAEQWLMSTYGTLNPTAEQKKMKSGQTVYNKVIAEYDELSKNYMAGTAAPIAGSTTKGSSGVKRLASPTKRLANVFGGQRQPRRRGRTPLDNEQFFNLQAGQTGSQLPAEGQTFVPKQQFMRTPSWASGTAVGAAIEGWNIGVEADNYRSQLEADIKDSQEREWKGLVEEAKQRSTEDASLLALFDQYKSDYAAAQSLPPAEREEKMRNILGGVAQVEKAKSQHKQIMDQLNADKGNIAWNMMSEEQQDELLTIMKGGGTMGFLPDENGQIVYTGSTRHGMPYKKSLESLLDPETGILNYPKKADVYGVIDQIAEGVEKDKYMREVEGPDGMIRKVPVPIEELQRELDFEIDQAIQQYGAKSLAANLPAFQGKGGHAKWQAGMNVSSDMAGNSVNILKRNMVEALHHKLGGYMAQETVKAGAGYKSQLRMREEQIKQQNRERLKLMGIEAAKEKEAAKIQAKGKGTPADYAASAKYLLGDASEGSTEVITQQGEEAPETTGEQAFTYYPRLDNLQGKGIGAVDQSNGKLTIYAPQTQREKDGETTTSTKILKEIDLTQPIEKLQQDLANVAREFNIIYNKPALPGKNRQ